MWPLANAIVMNETDTQSHTTMHVTTGQRYCNEWNRHPVTYHNACDHWPTLLWWMKQTNSHISQCMWPLANAIVMNETNKQSHIAMHVTTGQRYCNEWNKQPVTYRNACDHLPTLLQWMKQTTSHIPQCMWPLANAIVMNETNKQSHIAMHVTTGQRYCNEWNKQPVTYRNACDHWPTLL